jgi:hypothetical protein
MKTSYAYTTEGYTNAWYQRFSTLEELTIATEAREAKLEKLAGRQLTKDELVKGVKRIPMNARDSIAHSNWTPVADEAPPVDENPHRRRLAEVQAQEAFDKMSIRERAAYKDAQAWDAKRAAELKQAERDADPVRQRAAKLAADQLDWAMYAPEATAADIAHSERALRQLQEGSVAAGITLLEQGRQRIESVATEKAQELEAALAKVREAYQGEKLEQPQATESHTFYPSWRTDIPEHVRDESNRKYSQWQRENKKGVYAS